MQNDEQLVKDVFDELFKEYWLKIVKLHTNTKELCLLSEELSVGLKLFLQPMKEQRDSLEHIIRAKARFYDTTYTKQDYDYIKGNMSKAFGHEYRAFFDTADYLCINIRMQIAELLSNFEMKQIITFWPEYLDRKAEIVLISESIAILRNSKDVENTDSLIKEVENYYTVVKALISIYKHVLREVLPKLGRIL